jgi:hypothetical protein
VLLLAIAIKPFVALVVFSLVLWASRWLYRRMPESRLKRLLFSPLPGHTARKWD